MSTVTPFIIIGLGLTGCYSSVLLFAANYFTLRGPVSSRHVALPLLVFVSGCFLIPMGLLVGAYQAVNFFAKLVG